MKKEGIYRCAKCETKYCSKSCQLSDWKIHKDICKANTGDHKSYKEIKKSKEFREIIEEVTFRLAPKYGTDVMYIAIIYDTKTSIGYMKKEAVPEMLKVADVSTATVEAITRAINNLEFTGDRVNTLTLKEGKFFLYVCYFNNSNEVVVDYMNNRAKKNEKKKKKKQSME